MALAWPASRKLLHRPSGLLGCPVGTPWGLVSSQGFAAHLGILRIGLGITGNPGMEEMGLGA